MASTLNFEEWTQFLNNATVGIHLVGGDGTILWANDPELQALGYSKEEYLNRSITDFHVDKDVIERILATLVGGGSLNNYPARMRAKDGSIKHVLINSNVFRKDGEFEHTRCFTSVVSGPVYNQLRAELEQSSDTK